jgi:hypothetical protein
MRSEKPKSTSKREGAKDLQQNQGMETEGRRQPQPAAKRASTKKAAVRRKDEAHGHTLH